MHIGFLFNHHGAHQVAHALPVALALLGRGTNARVSILVSEGCEGEVRRLAAAAPGASPEIVRLRPPSTLARLRAVKATYDPTCVFRDNFAVEPAESDAA